MCAIRAAAIGDDDVARESRWNFANDVPDRPHLIQRGDDDGYRLHRIPQFWQGAGGTSDSKDVRKSV